MRRAMMCRAHARRLVDDDHYYDGALLARAPCYLNGVGVFGAWVLVLSIMRGREKTQKTMEMAHTNVLLFSLKIPNTLPVDGKTGGGRDG